MQIKIAITNIYLLFKTNLYTYNIIDINIRLHLIIITIICFSIKANKRKYNLLIFLTIIKPIL